MYDYIIIGGGMAGISSAYHLNKKYKILLLEATDKLGGRILSEKYKNNFINYGPQWIEYDNIKHLFKSVDIAKKNAINKNSFEMFNKNQQISNKQKNLIISIIKHFKKYSNQDKTTYDVALTIKNKYKKYQELDLKLLNQFLINYDCKDMKKQHISIFKFRLKRRKHYIGWIY